MDRTLTDAFSQYTRALEMGDVSKAKEYGRMIAPHVPKMIDVRVEGQKRGYVGEMFLADGAKDRFMNMYLGFHTNMWKPIVPGMVDRNPMTERYLPFTQIAAPIDRARETEGARQGENLSMLRNLEAYGFNEKTGRLEMSELMATHKNAYRDVYWRMEPAAIHLIREQSHEMMMEMFNPYARIPIIKQIVENYRKRQWEPNLTAQELHDQHERLNNLVLRKTGMTMTDWQHGVNLMNYRWDEEKLAGAAGQSWYEKTWMIKRIHRILAIKWERRAEQWKYTKAMMDGSWAAENLKVAAQMYGLQKGRKR